MADSNSTPPAVTDEAKAKKKEDKKQEAKAQQEKKLAKLEAKKQKQQQLQSKKPKEEKKLRLKEEYVNPTPKGEKKDMSSEMDKSYNPPAVEAAWYDWWQKEGFFSPEYNDAPGKENFVIIIPPPNVTGQLHLGHALTNSVQDALCRWNRMRGKRVLWVPGTDHAGIATQVVVEKKLMKESKQSRHDLGREAFVEKVWDWKRDYGAQILSQLRRLGSSLDWNREFFSMDDKCSRAVTEAFVRLYDDGLISRAVRLVNWDCSLKTAVSDIEVDQLKLEKPTDLFVPGYTQKVTFGTITHFCYPIEGSDEKLTIATTRLETMLADTAVAIHPKDPRYTHLHGRRVLHPFHNRSLPIILDEEFVDMAFGTGVVKITPAHDKNDFLVGRKHNLPFINLLNDDGTLNENGGPFQNMKRYDARRELEKQLKEKGLFVKIEANPMILGVCSRSKDVIEPVLKPQWWLDFRGKIQQQALDAVKDGSLKLEPEHYHPVWSRWLTDLREWCISRQLWWGHRIPAYLVHRPNLPGDSNNAEHYVVGRTEEEALQKASLKFNLPPQDLRLQQDTDVLDTWFSAGLFPFAVFGWPDQTKDLLTFFPTQCLETGNDILFFWVARMVFMSLQLTGQLPFTRVLLHALVRDAHGRKMSKSLGNAIDPVNLIEGITLEDLQAGLEKGNLDPRELDTARKAQQADFPNGISECGTDAVRFALCALTSQGKDINLDINRVVVFRNFCNKLWNVTKFVLPHVKAETQLVNEKTLSAASKIDLWLLSRLAFAVHETNEGLSLFDLARATTALHNFWLQDLCDVYVESVKGVLYADADQRKDEKEVVASVLLSALHVGLRLLHPFMPFITEELFHRLPAHTRSLSSIMISPYPLAQEFNNWRNAQLEEELKLLLHIVHEVRSLRASYNLTKTKVPLLIRQRDRDFLIGFTDTLKTLSFSTEVNFVNETPGYSAAKILDDKTEIFLPLKGIVDIPKELTRLEKKLQKLQKDLADAEKKMTLPTWEKVPDNVKTLHKELIETWKKERESTDEMIKTLKSCE